MMNGNAVSFDMVVDAKGQSLTELAAELGKLANEHAVMALVVLVSPDGVRFIGNVIAEALPDVLQLLATSAANGSIEHASRVSKGSTRIQ